MAERPQPDMESAATAVVRRLQGAGFEAYWVGGCVRDRIVGKRPGDFDIVTSALPDKVQALFKKTIPVGRQFGIVVAVESGHQFQVATFRAEADYQDGRHPGWVTFADAKADALRRDFTVNGLFFDPVSRRLHDWVGGEKDIAAKIIRTIGNPAERFTEDHLRLLRAVRFAAQLGFEIEAGTMAELKRNAAKIRRISAERVREELVKLFAPPHASRGLALLRESTLLEHILPEIAATITCEQSPDFHPEGTVFNHLLLMLQHLPEKADPLLAWSVLLHDVAKPLTASRDRASGSIHFYGHERVGAEMSRAILERMRFPRKEIEAIVKAVRCHMQFKDAPQMRKATLRRLLMRPTFALELQLHRLDCLGSHGELDIYDFLLEEEKKLKEKPALRPPLLTGHDLISMGMKPGPAMGKLLGRIRDLQLQDELQTPEQARRWVREELGGGRK